MIAALAILLMLVGCATADPSDWRARESHRKTHREIILVGADDSDVVTLDPAPYFDAEGRLPGVIIHGGRAYERGYTQQGNTDRDERLWFELDWRNVHGDRRILIVGPHDIVAVLDPEPYLDQLGNLPRYITYNGVTYERGWTQYGNTDADERLWFEVETP